MQPEEQRRYLNSAAAKGKRVLSRTGHLIAIRSSFAFVRVWSEKKKVPLVIFSPPLRLASNSRSRSHGEKMERDRSLFHFANYIGDSLLIRLCKLGFCLVRLAPAIERCSNMFRSQLSLLLDFDLVSIVVLPLLLIVSM